jgi:hypothetical protein
MESTALHVPLPPEDFYSTHSLMGRHHHRRFEARERGEVIYPDPNGELVFVRELPRETPAHTGIAQVVDDSAEHIPALRHARYVPWSMRCVDELSETRGAAPMWENTE